MRVNFEHDFKPTTTQEIISFKYDNYDDYKQTIELLDRLPVRYMINRPVQGVFSDTNMHIDVIVPRKRH